MKVDSYYKQVLIFTGLVVFSLIFACMGEWRPFFLDIDEPKYITSAIEMAVSGDWLHPMLGGLPRMEKPPLPYWLTAPLIDFFGTSFTNGIQLFIARIPAISCSVLTVIATYLIGKKLYSAKVALFAALLLAVAPPFKVEGMMLKADIIYLAAATWATYFYLLRYSGNRSRTNQAAAALTTSLGVLTKGPFALAPLVGFLVAEYMRDSQKGSRIQAFLQVFKRELSTILTGTIIGCGPFLFWIYYASSPGMDYLTGMLNDVSANTAHRGNLIFFYAKSIGFYLYETAVVFFPLGPFSLCALYIIARKKAGKLKDERLLLWTALIYMLLNMFLFRLRAHRYFLPILPFLAIITVHWLLSAKRDKHFKYLFTAGTTIAAAVAAAVGAGVLISGKISVNLWENVPVYDYQTAAIPFALAAIAIAIAIAGAAIKFYRNPEPFLWAAFIATLAIYPFYFSAAPDVSATGKLTPAPLIAENLAEMIKDKLPVNCMLVATKKTIAYNPELHFFLRKNTGQAEGGYLVTLPFDVQKFSDMLMASGISMDILQKDNPDNIYTPLYKHLEKQKFYKTVLILSGHELTQLYRNSIYMNKMFGSPAASIPIQGLNISWHDDLLYVVFLKAF